MTITYVAAGTAATGNNASVTPGAIAGIAAGDLAMVMVSIRNTGTGSVNFPAGWAEVASGGSSGAVKVLGRFWQTGDAMPTITFAAGVANADTMARAIAFRGVSADALTRPGSPASQLNGSAQNIAYPALDVPGDRHAVVIAAWKQDDATAYTTPSGFTAVGLTSTTTGDDASQALFYKIETTEADVGSGTITVTGGASAISIGIVAALKPAAAIVVNEQASWPPRAQVVLTGLTVGDQIDVFRVVAGQRTLLRGGHTDGVTDTAFIVTDAELPFGVPVSYVAVVEGAVEYATGATTYILTGGKVAISDAISGAAAEVQIGAAGDLTNGRTSSRMRVGGRNVVVTGPAGQDEGSYEVVTLTTTAYQNLISLLEGATEATVLIRQPGGGYDGIDAYLTVDAWTTRRMSQDGTDPKRLVTIEFAQTDGWPPVLTARGFTFQDLADAYDPPNNTFSDLAGDYATFLDLAQGDFS